MPAFESGRERPLRRLRLAATAAIPLVCMVAETAAFAQPAAYSPPPAAFDRACADMARAALPQTKIVRAEPVRAAGEYAVPGTENGIRSNGPVKVHRAFCRVAGVVEPQINFEVWMPAENWNGRFHGFGLGAFYGKLPYADMAASLDQGYAVGGTDTGHMGESDDASWALLNGKLNTQLVGDWAGRGIHEMTVKSKAAIQSVYGRPAAHSYFTGCSSGGYQALTEAQRYPSDYDGILAGAPANYLTHLQAAQISFGLATHAEPGADLEKPINKLPALYKAVMDDCDGLDGVKDGLIQNPAVCRFDPATIGCKGKDGPECLTPAQVKAVRRIYSDIRRKDGSKIFPGFPRGSERDWRLMSADYPRAGGQVAWAESFYSHFVFQDPKWSYRTMNVERDVAYADQHAGRLNAIDPDLRPFRNRGGKLIQYHGWSDWGITPYSSIDYFNSVVAKVGGSNSPKARQNVEGFYRLFMLPGVSHCRGGVGPDTFDGLGALVAWVERGEAPKQMVATRIEGGKPVRTRPLCVYPEVARYKGRGGTDEAASFTCAAPAKPAA